MTQPNPNNPSPEMIEAGVAAYWDEVNLDALTQHERQTIVTRIYLAMQAQQPNPSPADEVELLTSELRSFAVSLHRRFFHEVTHWQPLDDPRGIFSQIDNMVAGICMKLDEADSELTTLQARLDAIRAELETGIANLHETLEGEEDRFWSRYWQGYLKAYESLLEKFGAISGDKA